MQVNERGPRLSRKLQICPLTYLMKVKTCCSCRLIITPLGIPVSMEKCLLFVSVSVAAPKTMPRGVVHCSLVNNVFIAGYTPNVYFLCRLVLRQHV